LIRTIPNGQCAKNKRQLLADVSRAGKKITVIVGLSKNAGKTTVLNWLVNAGLFKKTGIITTGRDGEDIDVIEGHKKPKVYVPASSLYTTGAAEINRNSAWLSVREKLPYKAGGKNLWLVEAKVDIESEVIGPPSVREQIEIAKIILSHGADHIFIDGSLDRKAISAAIEVDSLIIVTSSVYGNLPSLQKELSRLYELSGLSRWVEERDKLQSLNKITIGLHSAQEDHDGRLFALTYKSLLGHEKDLVGKLRKLGGNAAFVYLPGSLTERSFKIIKTVLGELPELKIVINHPFNLKIDDHALQVFKDRLFALNSMDIAGVAVNSFAVDGNHIDCELLRESVRREVTFPVIDVQESAIGS